MKCEKCKQNEATFFYEETVNGKTRSYHLCRDCAEKMKESGELQFSMDMNDETDFPLFPSFPNLLGELFGVPERNSRRLSGGGKKCPGCGATWEDLVRNGKVSCPQCYDTFRDELASTIREVHGNVTHTGRAPQKLRVVNEKKEKLERCRRELQEAIKAENFERAAELRDEIKALDETKEAN